MPPAQSPLAQSESLLQGVPSGDPDPESQVVRPSSITAAAVVFHPTIVIGIVTRRLGPGQVTHSNRSDA
jgi:hypothetical protein